MPVPTVSDYIPDTAGDFSAGVGLARQIQANRQAAFERAQQVKQLEQQRQLANQAQINSMMERGYEPVVKTDGSLDPDATVQKNQQNALLRSTGALHGQAGLEPDEDALQNPHYAQGYQTGTQARLQQAARLQAAQTAANSRENVADKRNEGAANVANIRSQQAAAAAKLRSDTALGVAGMHGDLNWGGPNIQTIKDDDGTEAKIVNLTPHRAQLLPPKNAGADKLKNRMTEIEFATRAQQASLKKPEEQAAFFKDLLKEFHDRNGDSGTAIPAPSPGGPPTVTSKEQFDALKPGDFYINGKTGKRGQKPAQ